jgi:hypothetical protein
MCSFVVVFLVISVSLSLCVITALHTGFQQIPGRDPAPKGAVGGKALNSLYFSLCSCTVPNRSRTVTNPSRTS